MRSAPSTPIKPVWTCDVDGGQIHDKAVARRVRRAAAGQAKVRDRRRFKANLAASGTVRVLAPADLDGTMFPHTVRQSPGEGETILKDGAHNSKIGGDVLVGDLKGARIFTLALEERATCPRSCGMWRECYGNGMPQARRWQPSSKWEVALWIEVGALCRRIPRVLVRLHVLGDFYSMRYLALWTALLDRHPGLSVFGFTAHQPGTTMGDAIARVRGALGRRFSIRHSGRLGAWGSAVIDFPTELNRIGDAVVCPEQRAANGDLGPDRSTLHCGSCALCWSSDSAIIFIQR